MNAVLTPTRMTPQEYLDWESTQLEKHENVGGQVYAMTGARLNHNRIAGNAFTSLRQGLQGLPCEAFRCVGAVKPNSAPTFGHGFHIWTSTAATARGWNHLGALDYRRSGTKPAFR